jgi:hypothetical protein
MAYKLGENIKAGNKIKTENGWRKVKKVVPGGVWVSEGVIKFGSVIYGWKAK